VTEPRLSTLLLRNRLPLIPANLRNNSWNCARTSSGCLKDAHMEEMASIGFKRRSNYCGAANTTAFMIPSRNKRSLLEFHLTPKSS